jgi:peptidoglycan/LPS O-acetylase OafA/YrhL
MAAAGPGTLTKRRWIQLDLLRAFAVLLVIGTHMRVCPVETNVVMNRITRAFLQGGWCGVDLFFVLSGFLVSGLLFREYQRKQSLAIGHFLARRGLKIYPGFWFLMIATVIVAGRLRPGEMGAGELTAELLFVQNYFDGVWKHTWSLAVEEHFYLSLALLIGLLRYYRPAADGNPFRSIPAISLVVFVACLAFRLARDLARPEFDFRYHQAPSHLRMDSLMLGVLLSYWYHFDPRRLQWLVRWKYPLAVLGLSMLLLPFAVDKEQHRWMLVIGFSIIAAGSGLLTISFMSIELPRGRLVTALGTVGAYSYSIYLWHFPIEMYSGEIIERLTGWQPNWYAIATIYVSLSLAVGIAAAKLVEMPVLRWRDRILPSHSGTVPEFAAGLARGSVLRPEPIRSVVGATGTVERGGEMADRATAASRVSPP